MKESNNREELNGILRLIVKTSFLVFLGIFLSKIISYLYRIIIARSLGPEAYGLFSIALMILGWFIAFSSLGLTQGLLRYIPFYRGNKEFDKIRYIFKFSVILLFFSTIFSGIILFFFSEFISINLFHNPNLTLFLKIFSFLIPLSVLSSVFLSIIQSYERIGWYSFILNILQNLVKLSVLILVIYLGFGLNSIIISYFAGILVTLLVSYLFCKYKLSEIFWKVKLNTEEKKKISNSLIIYSFPLMFSEMMSNIFYWIDSFFIGIFKDVSAVGIYNAAVPIAVLLSFAPGLFLQLFFPIINREYSKKNISLIVEISKQISKWVFIINLPIFIFMFFFPGAVINILFGVEYLSAVNALRLLAVGGLISSIFIVFPQVLLMLGKSKIFLVDMILASILNIVLNFFLIPMDKIGFITNSDGITGAALATTISMIFLNMLFFLQVKKQLHAILLGGKIAKIFLISIIPTFLLVYLTQSVEINFFTLIFLSSVFVIIYLLLILITGCFDKNDMMIIKSIKNKIFSYKR
ncbi:MAG: flippase [archaeon]|nr:flippase [archaeon]